LYAEKSGLHAGQSGKDDGVVFPGPLLGKVAVVTGAAQAPARHELIVAYATAEEQAAVIAFLASGNARHITGEIVETGRRAVRNSEVLGFVPRASRRSSRIRFGRGSVARW
jgi:hypothetical protein